MDNLKHLYEKRSCDIDDYKWNDKPNFWIDEYALPYGFEYQELDNYIL